MNADQLLDNYNELQKIELRKTLRTFTLKELKKEIIKMKADKFAVTKMKRRQIIELIVQYHYLFPHLLTNKGTKRTAKVKQLTTRQPNTQLMNQLASPSTNYPQLNYIPTQNIPQQTANNQPSINELLANTEGIPLDILQQAFPNQFTN